MALTDDEKKLARAYNMGYMLNTYEPALVSKIIKSNPNNEFVKAMQVGRDHQEFHAGIPRKDYSRDFKNGFYNGRTLAEHNPNMIDRLMMTKGVSNDYKKGLESAKKEFSIRAIQQKINQEPKAPSTENKSNESFKKGFNVGYQFAERQPFVIDYAKTASDRYSKYVDGMKAGAEQYKYDLEKLQEKNPEARIFSKEDKTSVLRDALIDHKLMGIDEISRSQHKIVDQKEAFDNMPAPKWMQKDTADKVVGNTDKEIDKDDDLDVDR